MSHVAWESRRRGGEWLQWRGKVVEVFASAPRRKHVVDWMMYVVRHGFLRIQDGLVMAPHAADRVRYVFQQAHEGNRSYGSGFAVPYVSRPRDVAEQWTVRDCGGSTACGNKWSSDIPIGMTNWKAQQSASPDLLKSQKGNFGLPLLVRCWKNL